MRTALNYMTVMAKIAQPIIPDAARTILDALGVAEDARNWPSGDVRDMLTALPVGQSVEPPEVLFKKIEDTDIEAWSERFGGAD